MTDLTRAALSRRSLLRGVALGGAALGGQALLTACGVKGSAGGSGGSGGSSARTIKIGYVSPQTGALAAFGEADTFVTGALKDRLAKGVTINGTTHPVQLIVKDSQSDSNRAGSVASDLILNDAVDLMLVASTPDTTNPVSDQCEANGVPCISTVAPWQSWYFGRGAKQGTTYAWTYHFFWGLEDIETVYLDIWNGVSTNKKVGGLWPNDADGNAFAAASTGFPGAAGKAGYSVTDPGRYSDGSDQFSAQIQKFKSADCEVFTGIPIPPDFTTFWKQAAQQGYRPKVATVAKAMLFPSAADALGDLAQNIGTEVWWSPTHPFTSSLTGQSCQQLSDAYTASTSKQWTQPIGFVHALFEVAFAALAKAGAVGDRKALATALATLSLSTIVGPLDWSAGPVKNVTKTPLVGGQWRKGTTYAHDLVIVTNSGHTNIPKAGSPEAIG